MSRELCDLRAKITADADAVLTAIAKVTGRDKSDVAREVLSKWAAEQIHVASLVQQHVLAEGLRAMDQGGSGKTRQLRTASQSGES